jgi:hypothetical protein
MKNILLLIALFFCCTHLFAQEIPADSASSSKIYVVTKNDGTKFLGVIIKNDAREVLVRTQDRGDVYIPKHEIKEIKELEKGQLDSSGNLILKHMFSTRYFLTTNALPMDKGDNYAQINLFGPEFHFGVGKTFNLGIMTSWIGAPIIGAAKQSFKLADGAHFAVGGLFGTGSYVFRNLRWFALPFGALTLGNSKSNFNISYGYGMVNTIKYNYSYGRNYAFNQTDGSSLLSIAFMTQLNNKITFLFDSMILFDDGDALGFLSPGLRFQIEENKAFQFGFLIAGSNGEFLRIPFPMVSWFRKI